MKTSLDPHPPALSFSPTLLSGRPNQAATNESYSAQSQGATIALTTSEGDRITISQSSVSQQLRAEYTTDESYRLMEQSMTASGMSLAVQGDLNDQEVADLTALLNDLGSIATNFFNGNLEDAVNGALNIGDMGSISKLEATFSRTSVLTSYMSGPHPIPSFAGLQPGLDLKNSFDGPANPPEQNMTDLLSGQWRQFLDELTSQDTPPKEVPPPQRRPRDHHHLSSHGDRPLHPSKPLASSAELAGKEMVERSKETMNTHPRLTPLMPSVAELAIDQVRQRSGQGLAVSQMAKAISSAFNKEFNGWLL